MKIWILSDLHLEMQAFSPTLPDADVAVLAGDISRPLAASVEWIAAAIAWKMPVILVPGNHEFYEDSVEGGLARGIAAAAEHPGIHLLHDRSVVLDGVRFVGGTLWTDYALGATSYPSAARDRDIAYAMRAAGGLSPDHQKIQLYDDRAVGWGPDDALAAHRRTRAFLESELARGHAGPTVVVTHHGCAPGSVDPQFEFSPVTPAFVSDLTELIYDHQPALWVHGHVHDSFDFFVGDTRIVCNPHGYGHENMIFDPALLVEVMTDGR